MKSGAKKVVGDLVKGEALPVRPDDEIEQLRLFDDFDAKTVDPFEFAKAVRKAGRPKGSLNKATLANKEYCQKRGYACALDLIAVEAMQDPREVQKRFACTIEAAMQWVRDMRFELAEYTEKKMPRAVELDSDGPLSVVVANFQMPRNGASAPAEDVKIIDAHASEVEK